MEDKEPNDDLAFPVYLLNTYIFYHAKDFFLVYFSTSCTLDPIFCMNGNSGKLSCQVARGSSGNKEFQIPSENKFVYCFTKLMIFSIC